MRRGELWWASLPPPRGSAPGFRRPVLVVQSDTFNDSRINTVVVAAITSNVRLGEAPGNVLLPQRRTGLTLDSIANVSQVLTVDKSLLTERIGILDPDSMAMVEAGLRLVLSL